MRLIVVGTGRAARALMGAWPEGGHELIGVAGRDRRAVEELAALAGAQPLAIGDGAWPAADGVVVAVSDGAIAEVARSVAAQARPGALWLHLSGSQPAARLSAAAAVAEGRALAFHPLAVLDGRPRTLRGVLV